MGSAALLGFPPSGIFFSELGIVVAGWQAGLGWVVGVMIALVLLVFAALGRHILAMMLTRHPEALSVDPDTDHGSSAGPMVPLWAALAVVAVSGALAWPLVGVLRDAVVALGVGR